jgi:hypothetical protein
VDSSAAALSPVNAGQPTCAFTAPLSPASVPREDRDGIRRRRYDVLGRSRRVRAGPSWFCSIGTGAFPVAGGYSTV